jgi:hypothetical protein
LQVLLGLLLTGILPLGWPGAALVVVVAPTVVVVAPTVVVVAPTVVVVAPTVVVVAPTVVVRRHPLPLHGIPGGHRIQALHRRVLSCGACVVLWLVPRTQALAANFGCRHA